MQKHRTLGTWVNPGANIFGVLGILSIFITDLGPSILLELNSTFFNTSADL